MIDAPKFVVRLLGSGPMREETLVSQLRRRGVSEPDARRLLDRMLGGRRIETARAPGQLQLTPRGRRELERVG